MERTGFEQWKPREVARLLALVETERRYYQEILAALPAPLVVLASDRTILSANRAFRMLVRLGVDELRQKNIDQVLPSHELTEAIRAAHVHGETRPLRLNTMERTLSVAIVPIRSWEDDLEAETLLLLEDLSGIQTGAAPGPRGLPAAPAMLWEADPSTLEFTSVGGDESILGYSARHWRETPHFLSERIHPQDRAAVMSLYQALAAAGGEASAEFRALSASGQVVWCRETVRVAEAPGRGLIASGVLTAIGQRRQMEAQSILAGRTEALRELAARLAHDLNNPLMIVTGYVEEILQALPAGNPSRADLTQVLAAATRMSEVTGRLLSFARPGIQTASKVELRDVVAGLPASVGKVALSAETGVSMPGLRVAADRQQLIESIEALAVAAIEGVRAATAVQVVCGTESIAEQVKPSTLAPGVYARIEIRAAGEPRETTGAGVLDSVLPAKDPARVAGPGAARAYAAIRQWGGDVFSLSAAGGAAFAIYLPLAEPPTRREETPAAPVPRPAAAPAAPKDPSRETILLVEDESGIRDLVRKILRRENYNVIEAGSAEEALSLGSSFAGRIHLLLTDVMLPGMSGRDLAGQMRGKDPRIKIVYISGYTDDVAVRAGEFPPGAKFLQKPFTLGALISTVSEVLKA